jgi:hypothetical protein
MIVRGTVPVVVSVDWLALDLTAETRQVARSPDSDSHPNQ